ncbi:MULTISPECIES: hypothetical protein [unclassified Nocardia]|uniref:hypothetical protein n=1 Tax=unclassified Nocardia TaxID=2637762 RepID=UPI00278BC484|nr:MULTISPECIES: hypothetical protein [unclassified Nocardia]
MAGRKTTSPPAITRAQRQEKALKLRLAGASYRAIAEKLEISSSQAHRDVTEALAELKREPAQAVLDLELHRLDQMLLGLFKEAVSGNIKAVLAALRIMDRRARYLGLDNAAPPDTSVEARAALDEMHQAILAMAGQAAVDGEPS